MKSIFSPDYITKHAVSNANMKLTVDNKQRLKTGAQFLLEFYKVLMGTFLVAFIPQQCDDGVCAIMDNVNRGTTEYTIGNIYNVLACIAVVALYTIELKRENWCIKYLDIDPSKPNNNLDHEIENYTSLKEKMKKLNHDYLLALMFAMFFLITNFGLSLYVVRDHYITSSSTTNVVGYGLLLSSKLNKAYMIGNTSVKEERAYSGYLTTSKTYNTIDVDFRIDETSSNDNEEEIVQVEILDDSGKK